ncbi:unnamed protein product [Adineta ricciae]|uniref:Uncharacterized protein n=1 Tax=Adineta ricciae TaxID=249248 RepID=A0A815U3R4_ADIRI|nr:unnamed protein product [Adineta ricciae]
MIRQNSIVLNPAQLSNGIATCDNRCYNSSASQCFNGTVCPLGNQLCIVKYDPWSGYQYGSPSATCYDPLYQVCSNNSLCNYPSRVCNGQCMKYGEVCVNNVTVCNVSSYYFYYQPGQIKLCNGTCYDSAIQKCVSEYTINCTRDPFTQECIGNHTDYTQNSTTSTSSNCCEKTDCITDSDCCVQGKECQCYKHNNQDYGSCLNPNEQPICSKGCTIRGQCRNDTDCCKCQCGQITVTNVDGTVATKKQCVQR